MREEYCDACYELNDGAYEFVEKGVTPAIDTRLRNDEVVAEVGEELHIAAGGADGDGVAVGHLVVVVDDGVLGVHGVCETQKKNE